MICVHIVFKTENKIDIYLADDTVKSIWTRNKMKAKIFTDDDSAQNNATKFNGYVSSIPIIR